MKREVHSLFVAVLSDDKEEQKALAEALGAEGADFDIATSARELRDIVCNRACNGILLFIAALIRLKPPGKEFIRSLENLYPVTRIRWNKSDGSFGLMASCPGIVESVADFLAVCSSSPQRRMRLHERMAKTLNVLISPEPDLAEAERTFTIDVSPGSCFLHTRRDWSVGDSVFLRIHELHSQAVIEACVARCVPWGVHNQVQGIGLTFLNISTDQVKELEQILYGSG